MGENCKYCNQCPHHHWKTFEGSTSGEYTNLLCEHDPKVIRYVEFTIKKDKMVDPPSWCPLMCSKNKDERVSQNPIYNPQQTKKVLTVRDKWGLVKPQVKWSDIKKNDVYHIPPHLGCDKRKSITVLYVSDAYFTCKDSDSNGYNIDYIYPNDILYKVMRKIN